jgi:hypothetical protein
MPSTQRSRLISSIAWCLILSAGLMALATFFQAFTLFFLVPREQTDLAVQQVRALNVASETVLLMLGNIRWMVLAVFLLSVLLLGVGVGLLERKEWARKAVFVILVLSILGMLPAFFMNLDPNAVALPMNDEMRAQIEFLIRAMLVTNALFCAVHAWIAWKLCRPEILAEFRPSDPKAASGTTSP